MPWYLDEATEAYRAIREGLTAADGTALLLHTHLDDALAEAARRGGELALFHVALPTGGGAGADIAAVPASDLTLVASDVSSFEALPAHVALDRVADPLADLESFRATRVRMPAEQFGQVVGDQMWEGEQTPFLVYAAGYWIEDRGSDRYELVLENLGWTSGPELSLADLEAKLFDYAREARGLEPAHADRDAGIPEL